MVQMVAREGRSEFVLTRTTLIFYWPRAGMFQVGKGEQLESTGIQVLAGKGAQVDWVVPGELHTLHLPVLIFLYPSQQF
jgi:hypothetical protein